MAIHIMERFMVSLVSIIIGLVIMAFFAGFNLDNSCSVNLIFYTFEKVPIFLTIIISFLIGAIFAWIATTFFRARRPEEKENLQKKPLFTKKSKMPKIKVDSANPTQAGGGESAPRGDANDKNDKSGKIDK